jgi:hypothetical protein
MPGLATEATFRAVQSLYAQTAGAPTVRLYGLAVTGLGQVVWSERSRSSQGQFQVLDTLAITAGRHQVRLGLDYLRLTPSRDEPITTAVARYAGLDDLIARRAPATMYGAAPGGESLIEIASAFAQDTWSASQRLNLTGLRWEYTPPSSRVLSPGSSRYEPAESRLPRPSNRRLSARLPCQSGKRNSDVSPRESGWPSA